MCGDFYRCNSILFAPLQSVIIQAKDNKSLKFLPRLHMNYAALTQVEHEVKLAAASKGCKQCLVIKECIVDYKQSLVAPIHIDKCRTFPKVDSVIVKRYNFNAFSFICILAKKLSPMVQF